MSRALVRAGFVASLLPLVVATALVRPADAATGYSSYGLTALAAGVRTAGTVGASGGLVTLDTGSGQVTARLDASPSSAVLAAPYEPGTFFRTVAGQGNSAAGEVVLDVPDAESQFPGNDEEATVGAVPPSAAGPVSGSGGSATAKASQNAATGTATGEDLTVAGVLESNGSTSAVSLSVDPARGTTTLTGTTRVARVVAAGVLELRDVVATASVTSDGDRHTAEASLTVGGASVAGQAVELSDEGVVAVGTPLLPGQTVQDATDQANAALMSAGVQVRTLGGQELTTSRSATADTGGLSVTVSTPTLPGGVAGNLLETVVGGVVLTEVDEAAVTVVDVPPIVDVPPPSDPVAPGTITTVVPGVPGTPGSPGSPATAGSPPGPSVAAPATALPSTLLVAGRSMSPPAALAAFAVWQFLSLGTATLYALVERRRRQAALEALL